MDILVEIVEALERDAVPAEIRIASVLDRIRCLRSPNTGSRSLSLLAVEAYERGYQEAQSKFTTAEEHIFNKGFKEGRAMRRAEGKSAFEVGVEKGKKDTEKKNEREINHLQSALSQAGKNCFDIAEQRDTAYARGYQEAKRAIGELQQRELNERYSSGYRLGHVEGYNKGLDEFKNKWCTHDNAYQEGYRKGSDEKALQSATDIIRLRTEYDAEINHLQLALEQAGKNYLDLRQEYTNTLEKAKEEHAAKVLGLTYKNEQALEVKWREGYREGKGHAEEQLKSLQSKCDALRSRLNKSDSLLGTIQGNYAELEKRYHNLELNYHSVKFEYEVRYKRGHDDGYQKGLKDGHYNGLQEAAKAVDTKILATTHKEPTLDGIPEGSQVVVDTSNWDMRERVRK